MLVALVGFAALDRVRRAVSAAEDSTPTDGPRSIDLREHAWKWVIPAVLLLVVAAEGDSLASIGWRVESPSVLLGQVLVGFGVLVGSHVLTAPLWARVGDGGDSLAAGIGSFASLSTPERLFVAFTAGATEETAFHGYALERLLSLTGSAPLAGGLSAAAFVVGHAGDTWDRDAIRRIAQPALVMTLLYLWFRSLPALIAIHALNDSLALLLADRFDDLAGDSDSDGENPDASEAADSDAGNSDPDVADTSADTDASSLAWLRGE
nr:CPBP family intramembrane glutamic endopeptidase [Halobellus rarus]